MRLPIDTQNVKFAVAGQAEPVVNFETKAPRVDENGIQLFNVPLFAAGAGIKDTITVKIPGEPKGLVEFSQVRVPGLVATTWEVGGNHGVSFRGDRIEFVKITA